MAQKSFNRDLNMIDTGGMIGTTRRLGTYTIHYNETVNRYFVTDDWNDGRTVSSGHSTIDDAVKSNKWMDDKRLCNK